MTPPADLPPNDSTREASASTEVGRPSEGATLREAGPGVREELPAVAVPDHELITCVGRGAYGQVWLARNVMGTYRAVKIVERASFQSDRPFEREFNGILKFEPLSRAHPGLVDILQVGRTEACFYYVMELADDVATGQQIDPEHYASKTLRTELDAQGRLPFERCLRLALALTEALGHLHGHGLIHRDIKPSNIIFVHDLPLLADIGLVAEASDAKSFVGTEGFIPPEGPGTAQADLYSLGKVLYELATGKDRHAFPELPTLLGEGTGSDAGLLELNAVILKACDPDLKRRYQSAAAMRDDLLLLQGGKSVKHSQALERRLALLSRISVVGVIVTLVVGVGYWQTSRAHRIATKNLAQLYVANGVRAVSEGDVLGALPWLIQAFEQDEGDAERVQVHRQRLAWMLEDTPRLEHVFFHQGPVVVAKFSPDGGRVLTATGRRSIFDGKLTNGSAQVWNVDTGERVGQPVHHEGGVLAAEFSPNGRLFATAGSDHLGRVNASDTGTTLATLTGHDNDVTRIVFSPDGRSVVTASLDHSARVWDAASGQPRTPALQHQDMAFAAAFNSDGTRVATGGSDGNAVVWDATTGQAAFAIVSRHKGEVSQLKFSPNGRLLLSISVDRTARIWDAATGTPLTGLLKHGGEVSWGGFTSDGARVVTTSQDGTCRFWDAVTGEEKLVIRHHARLEHAALSPDGVLVATADSEGHAWLWNAWTGEQSAPPLPHSLAVIRVDFSPDGSRLLTASADGTVKVWDLASQRKPLSLSHRGPVRQVEFSPNGSLVATASADGTAQLWKTESGEPLGGPLEHAREVAVARFSPQGDRLVTASYDRTARIWDAATGQPITPPLHHGDCVVHAAFSRDGRRVATASYDRTARLWDATTGQPVTESLVHDREVIFVDFDPQGKRLVTASRDGKGRVWDAVSGKLLFDGLQHDDWVVSARFSPDGGSILTASSDGTARLWDAITGRALTPSMKHREAVTSAIFSPGGGEVLTASWDGTARIWDTRTGKPLTGGLRHQRAVVSGQFAPDGRYVVSCSYDGTCRTWDSRTGEPLGPPISHKVSPGGAIFSPDGRQLATWTGWRALLWNVPREDRSMVELKDEVRLLSWKEPDPTRGDSYLDESLASRLMGSSGTRSRGTAAWRTKQLVAWHRYQRVLAEQTGDQVAAAFHASRSELPSTDNVMPRQRSEGQAVASRPYRMDALESEASEFGSRVPPPLSALPNNVVDLTRYYTLPLSQSDNLWGEMNLMSSLPRRVQSMAGTTFDVRGQIQLQGVPKEALGYLAPVRIVGIAVGRKGLGLQFLHGTGWNESDGKPIARYVVHYQGGDRAEIQVVYGRDVRNFWLKDGEPAEPLGALRAWTGTNAYSAKNGVAYRLYKTSWKNPRPELEIETIDFESLMTDCAPFLIAITVDP